MYYRHHNNWGDCEATESRLKGDLRPTDKRLKADKNCSFSGLRNIQAEGLYMVSLCSHQLRSPRLPRVSYPAREQQRPDAAN